MSSNPLEKNQELNVSRTASDKSGETFYPGPSRIHLAAFPPKERWDNWTELDPLAWPQRKERHFSLVPTTCFNCESACGLLAYIDKATGEVRKFEGNPENPGCVSGMPKGPATLNQATIPMHSVSLKRWQRGAGAWDALLGRSADTIAGRSGKRLFKTGARDHYHSTPGEMDSQNDPRCLA